MRQPFIDAFSRIRTWRMRIHARTLVDDKQVLVLKKDQAGRVCAHDAWMVAIFVEQNKEKSVPPNARGTTLETLCVPQPAASYQNFHSPRHTTHRPNKRFVMACAVIASPRRFLQQTSP